MYRNRSHTARRCFLVLALAVLGSACGAPPERDPARLLVPCSEQLAAADYRAANRCYARLVTEPTIGTEARYGTVLAHAGLMVANVWRPYADLATIAGIAGGGGVLATSAARARTAARAPRAAKASLRTQGVPINLLFDEIFAAGISDAIYVRDVAAELLARDEDFAYEFDLPLDIALSDVSELFRRNDEPLRLTGRFGRLELLHLQGIAGALAALLQLIGAHDLTIADLDSLDGEPNFTTILAREPNFLGLRDPVRLREAGDSLAALADAIRRLPAESARRFDEDGWLIEAVDLHRNGKLDPRDVFVYTFIHVDLVERLFAKAAPDGEVDSGWLTFPSAWPQDFFDVLARGAEAAVANLRDPSAPLVPLVDLAPALAVLGYSLGPLVKVVDVDLQAIFHTAKGLRDYLPMYACQDGVCMPLESVEWRQDRDHFPSAVTSERPIDADDWARWPRLLAENGYDARNVDETFRLRMPLPPDGIRYAGGATGPANYYRLYQDPIFAGFLAIDEAAFLDELPADAAARVRAGRATGGAQFLTNALLAWYTVETGNESPFAATFVFRGLRLNLFGD